MRQDMVKEMKNDFEEDRKKLKQVKLYFFTGFLADKPRSGPGMIKTIKA